MISQSMPQFSSVQYPHLDLSASMSGLAITGIECLFPDAIDIKVYWQNILHKHCSIRPLSDPYLASVSQTLVPQRLAAVMPSLALKPQQFRIPPATARNFDPRVLPMLEVVRRLLDRQPDLNRQSTLAILCCQKMMPKEEASTWVYRRLQTLALLDDLPGLGQLPPQQQEHLKAEFAAAYDQRFPNPGFEGFLAESSSLMASIMSKTFNLGGGHIAMDATCASAISALQLAQDALEAGHHDAALIVALSPEAVPSRFSHYAEMGIFTNDAVLPFDAQASGSALGEGIGAMLVKRLPEAEAAGDPIYGTIRGIGFTSDGKGAGFVSPQKEGQIRAMQAAYQRAGVDPEQVRLVEAHATGTPKGDATELESLGEIFQAVKHPVGLGSVKGNIGHLLAASGMAGIFKVCCAMREGVMPPTLFRTPRTELWQHHSQFHLLENPQPWPDEPYRFAAVSSFGFGGVNAHLILEAHPSTAQGVSPRSGHRAVSVDSVLPSIPLSKERKAVLDPMVADWRHPMNASLAQTAAMPVAPAVSVAAAPAEVEAGVLQIVAECSGYEVNELQLDHDLDADLGIDSLKNMEILLKVGEKYRIQVQEGDQITDYPTIAKLVDLAQTRQNTATAEEQAALMAQWMGEGSVEAAAVQAEALPATEVVDAGEESPSSTEGVTPFPAAEVEAGVLQIVAECSGYEVNELQLDHDLDADLGIDSLKNMEILLKVGEKYRIQVQEGDQITDYPTIAKLVDLAQTRQNTATAEEQAALVAQWIGDDAPAPGPERPDPSLAAADPPRPAQSDASDPDLVQVQTMIAALRNYDPAWLTSHLMLHADLGLSAAEKASVFHTLGLAANGQGSGDLTLAELAVQVRQHRSAAAEPQSSPKRNGTGPVERSRPGGSVLQGLLPAQPISSALSDWCLILGQADPGSPQLAAAIQDRVSAADALLYPISLSPGNPRPFALVLDRASPTLAADIQTKLLHSRGESQPLQGLWWGEPEPHPRSLAWIFPGSGSLYSELLQGLLELSPVVAEVLGQAQQAYQGLTGRELNFEAQAGNPLRQRPATVAVSVAIARLLQELGLQPDLVAGHSVGELTACHIAGAFDLPELIRLTVAPFLGLDAVPAGKMVALLGPEAISLKLVQQSGGRLVISNRNSASQVVVSGHAEDIHSLVEQATAAGLTARELEVQTAYHSPLLTQAHQQYRQALQATQFQMPRVPVVSGLTGDLMPWSCVDGAQTRALLDCAFIAPVNYVAQVQRLASLGMGTLLDIGPTDRLMRLARETVDPSVLVVAANRSRRNSRLSLLEVLASLHVAGHVIRITDPQPTRTQGASLSTPALSVPVPVPDPPIAEPVSSMSAANQGLDSAQRRPMLLDPIAVVGLGGILPDAATIADFWQNLLSGHNAIREIPQDAAHRWDVAVFYDPDPQRQDKTYSKIGAFVPETEFKPMEFRIPPKTAAQMDRAQKLALLATQEAFKSSGYHERPFDRQRVKVIIGTSLPEFQDRGAPRLFFDQIAAHMRTTDVFQSLPQSIQSQIIEQTRAAICQTIPMASEDTTAGGLPNIVAGRVAFCFDLQGGNVVLDAACAGSLAAIDHAVKCLRLGEADMVVSGGSDANMSPSAYVGFCKTYALSAEKSCPFDADADGFVMGEGAGIVILKRLSDAERDGDTIQAVIRGVGSASDGKGRGITAPSTRGQTLAMRCAYADAGIDPQTIGLVEAHGTSTPVGDAVEFESLAQVFGQGAQSQGIYLGSVKSMIGHLKGAAGIAGLIKAILSVRSGQIPPTLNFNRPHPKIPLDTTSFRVNTALATWEHAGPTPRRAGVNSFGFGGTNYHVVVEAYDPAFYRSPEFQKEVRASHGYRLIYGDEVPPMTGAGAPGASDSPPVADLQPVVDLQQVLQTGGSRPLVVQAGAEKSLSVAESLGSPPFSGQMLVPALTPATLGAASFRRDHGLRFNYIAGAMAGGIGSVDMVVDMAKAGMLGFYGSGGVPLERVEQAIHQVQERLLDYPQAAYGFNLLHNPIEPEMEERTVDLYLRHGVRRISASAYMRLTSSVVRYRASGMCRLSDGRIEAPNHVFAKVSSPEIAAQFMAPPPEAMLKQLVSQGKLTPAEAELAAQLPVAQDVTAEADSGGHTDRRPLTGLLPQLLRLRDDLMDRYPYRQQGVELRVGAGGSIGDPISVRAALALGADYILTGSINQASLQAGTSPLAKQMLAEATMGDVVMAPAADMFEMGVQVQILKRGTFYAQRSRKLYALYKTYDSLESIPAAERGKLERDIFRQSLDEVWASTAEYWQRRDVKILEKANRDAKFKMALAFRSYLGLSSRWAQHGQADRKSDFQIWCGPAMGLFNSWVAGSWLADLQNRDVVLMGLALLHGAAVLTRAEQLSQLGVAVPSRLDLTRPAARETLTTYL